MNAMPIPASSSSLTSEIDDPFQWDDTDEYVHNSLVGSSVRDSDSLQTNWGTYGVNPASEPAGDVHNSLVGREREFHERISNVRDYASLQTNWDTYGGLPASEPAIAFSTDLLRELLWNPDVPPPHVSPISSGVYVAWVFGETKLYFEADDESVLFVAERSGHTIVEGEDPSFDTSKAARLVKSFFENTL